MGYIHIAVDVLATDPIRIDDRQHPSVQTRIVNLAIGNVTFMIGQDDDLERIAVLDKIVAAAQQLRDNAATRVAERDAAAALPDGLLFVGTVGEFLDGIEASCPSCGAGGSTPHWVECPERTAVAS